MNGARISPDPDRLFALGYGTRSYFGALVPAAIFASVVYVVRILEPVAGSGERPQPYDADVLDDVALVTSGLLVLIYLAGVVLARRRPHRSAPRRTADRTPRST